MSEQILKDLIKINPELVNTKDKEGRPLIFNYIKEEHFEEFKTLVELGADVHLKDENGQSLLGVLLLNPNYKGSFDHIRLLLKSNINLNLNIKNKYGDLPLHELSRFDLNSNIDLLQLVIDKTDDINKWNNMKNTALHVSVIRNRFENCKILLENGADQTIKNKYGIIPLEFYNGPNKSKYEELFKSFEKKETDQTIKNKYGNIPLEFYDGPNKSKYEELFKSFEKKETETDKEKLIKILEGLIVELRNQ